MISVIIYGRNDNHGYNLHKRGALSLNNIASLLEDDDEILFVDWNTPIGFSTFPEAISDTLNRKTKNLLKVIRVSPTVHDRLTPNRKRVTLEPIARNVAIRRSNPKNKWILSTNTDMVFLLKDNRKFRDVLESIEDGLYEIPRFAIPDSVWEKLNRFDPTKISGLLSDLSKKMDLKEIVSSGPILRYDAPGDFQLFPRKDIFEFGGFEEKMLLGWHVDSNLCRRFHLYYGETRSLENFIEGYHCEHSKTPTQFTSSSLSNDLERFFYSVSSPISESFDTHWGLSNVNLPMLNLPEKENFDLSILTKFAPSPKYSRFPVYSEILGSLLSYSLPHSLPYILELFEGSDETVSVGYLGLEANHISFEKLSMALLEKYRIDLVDLSDSRELPINLGLNNSNKNTPVKKFQRFHSIILDYGIPFSDIVDESFVTDSNSQWKYNSQLFNTLKRSLELISFGEEFNLIDENTRFITINAEHYGAGVGNRIKNFLSQPGANANSRVRVGTRRSSLIDRKHPTLHRLITRSLHMLPTPKASTSLQTLDKNTFFDQLKNGITSHNIFPFLIDSKNIFFTLHGTQINNTSKFSLYNFRKEFDSLFIEIDYPNPYLNDDIKELEVLINGKTVSLLKKIESNKTYLITVTDLNNYKDLFNFEFKVTLPKNSNAQAENIIPLIRIINIVAINQNMTQRNLNFISISDMKYRAILTRGWSYSNEGIHRWVDSQTAEIDVSKIVGGKKVLVLIIKEFNSNKIKFTSLDSKLEVTYFHLLKKSWGTVYVLKSKQLGKILIQYEGGQHSRKLYSNRNIRPLHYMVRDILIFGTKYPIFLIKVLANIKYIATSIMKRLN